MDNRVYVYEGASGFDIILSPRELTYDETHHLGERCMELLTVTTDINEMIKLFPVYEYEPHHARYKDLVEEFNNILGGSDGFYYSKEIK